jgi:threonine dehydrogenase-like Zn-dependent dehydrogenase
MKAFFLIKPGVIEIREINVPVPRRDEVLLKVKMVGFCGGDLNGYRGLFKLQEYPNILGHELGATIEQTGANVPDKFKVGMNVTLNPYLNCGICNSCRKGYSNACQDNRTMGVRRPGVMAQFITAHWKTLYSSNKLSHKELALVEPLSVGFHAVNRGRVNSKDRVAVIGCGMVGIGALAASVNRGSEVIAVDIDDSKMEIAKKIGVTNTINTSKTNLHKALAEITCGDGPDVIIEAAGNPLTYKAAIEEVAYKGRVICVGYTNRPVEINTDIFVKKEIEVLGARNSIDEFTEVISYLESGKFPVNEVITKIVFIDEAENALIEWSDNPGTITKIMVTFD